MAEVVEKHDLTVPNQDGGRWSTASDAKTARSPRRGSLLGEGPRCCRTVGERDALAAIADRGSSAALEYAELVESPATHGAVLISISFDPADDGNLRRRVSYERAPG